MRRQRPPRRLQRQRTFVSANAKILRRVMVFVALVALGALATAHNSAPESRASPGYQMVRDLQSSGAIDDFQSVRPTPGWESEYTVDPGGAQMRFRGHRMEYVVDETDGDLRNAIEAEARADGYSVVPG